MPFIHSNSHRPQRKKLEFVQKFWIKLQQRMGDEDQAIRTLFPWSVGSYIRPFGSFSRHTPQGNGRFRIKVLDVCCMKLDEEKI